MNKMYVFAEGYTEVVFCDRLIHEIATRHAMLKVEWRDLRGGTTCSKTAKLKHRSGPDQDYTHFTVIYDCHGDAATKTRMVAEYDNLVKANATQIVCIRDVAPDFSYAEIPHLERGLRIGVKTKPIVVDFILSVMEIEAWFLAEVFHYPNVDPSLSVASIVTACGFDPSNDDMQLRSAPANDLHACYQIVGQSYQKRDAEATIDRFDWDNVYVDLVNKFPYLRRLVTIIEGFFTPPP
jgi:hypothetical protein